MKTTYSKKETVYDLRLDDYNAREANLSVINIKPRGVGDQPGCVIVLEDGAASEIFGLSSSNQFVMDDDRHVDFGNIVELRVPHWIHDKKIYDPATGIIPEAGLQYGAIRKAENKTGLNMLSGLCFHEIDGHRIEGDLMQEGDLFWIIRH